MKYLNKINEKLTIHINYQYRENVRMIKHAG